MILRSRRLIYREVIKNQLHTLLMEVDKQASLTEPPAQDKTVDHAETSRSSCPPNTEDAPSNRHGGWEALTENWDKGLLEEIFNWLADQL